mmetsp:Transcript_17262/g.24392  ORF Transcript_17262/g.24392 Transcript_17262/m.24392 type:complete len:175 (+) Transcript_17262:507-1031(+)
MRCNKRYIRENSHDNATIGNMFLSRLHVLPFKLRRKYVPKDDVQVSLLKNSHENKNTRKGLLRNIISSQLQQKGNENRKDSRTSALSDLSSSQYSIYEAFGVPSVVKVSSSMEPSSDVSLLSSNEEMYELETYFEFDRLYENHDDDMEYFEVETFVSMPTISDCKASYATRVEL